MGAILVKTVLGEVSEALQDPTGAIWNQATTLLGYFNDGQRAIVTLKPNVGAVHSVVLLVAGSHQTIPNDGLDLIGVEKNWGTNGTTPGDAITAVHEADLTAVSPSWMTANPAAAAIHFTHNDDDPKAFHVYPPQPASSQGYIEIVYTQLPADVTYSDSAPITVPDGYLSALKNYILHRAWEKKKPELSQGYYNLFLEELGARQGQEQADTVNKRTSMGGQG